MQNSKKTIGSILLLVAVLALSTPAAHAQVHAQATQFKNPGEVGSPASSVIAFEFETYPNYPGAVDVVWTDNKTLEWAAGTHTF